MAHMPDWFAKTPEMMAMDRYYSGLTTRGDFDAEELKQRYLEALGDVRAPSQSFEGSKALKKEAPHLVAPGLTKHFRRDWLCPDDPFSTDRGGKFWPNLPSRDVLEGLKFGMEDALKRALGRPNIPSSMANDKELDDLFDEDERNDIDTSNVLPLITSWNCVAPRGSKFFDTKAIRGPTAVEWSIGTPKIP